MTHRLSRFGLTVDVHRGWDARLVRRRPQEPRETTHPVLHLGSLRMPLVVKGDYGSHVVASLGPRDVFVALKEFHPSLAHRGLFGHPVPWPLHPAMANPRGLQRLLVGQSGLQHFFSLQGRAFCLYVVLGAHRHRERSVPLVNRALAAVQVGPHEPHHIAHFVPQP